MAGIHHKRTFRVAHGARSVVNMVAFDKYGEGHAEHCVFSRRANCFCSPQKCPIFTSQKIAGLPNNSFPFNCLSILHNYLTLRLARPPQLRHFPSSITDKNELQTSQVYWQASRALRCSLQSFDRSLFDSLTTVVTLDTLPLSQEEESNPKLDDEGRRTLLSEARDLDTELRRWKVTKRRPAGGVICPCTYSSSGDTVPTVIVIASSVVRL